MRTSFSKSVVAGLAALSLTGSALCTVERAEAAGYEYRLDPSQGQVTRGYSPVTTCTHIAQHYAWPQSHCHHGYRYSYDAYGNDLAVVRYAEPDPRFVPPTATNLRHKTEPKFAEEDAGTDGGTPICAYVCAAVGDGGSRCWRECW
jgi:hypothetical protein